MPELDRGEKFGGYYLVDPARPEALFGAEWEHSFPCGTFEQDGTAKGVTFFVFYKDEFPDCLGKHAEAFDMSVDAADLSSNNPLIASLLMDLDVAQLIDTLTPTQRYLVEQDIASGFTGPQIIDRRIAILVPEFLGFTLEAVFTDHPYVLQLTIDAETGTESPNITRCSLEE